MGNSAHNPFNWLLLVLLTVIWGSSYILIKKALIGFTPVEMASLRISISFIASTPFLFVAIRSIPRQLYGTLLLIGIFGSGAPAFLFALSMSKSGSAVNGILNSLSPLWTLLIGFYLFRVPMSTRKVAGVLIGFAGALVLVLGKGAIGWSGSLAYSLLPVAATFCYGMSTNITKQKLQQQNAIYTTALALTMIGIPALIALFFTEAPQKIISGTVYPALLSVVLLSVFGTVIAWMLFYRLVQRTDALFAASVTYLIPIVAVAWGLLDGEVLNAVQLSGMLLILAGVYFTTSMVVAKK